MVDTTPPILVGTSPADNATSVPLDSNQDLANNIVLTFNEAVGIGNGASGGDIQIRRSSDNSLIELIDPNGGQVQASGNTITINPNQPLDYATEYFVYVSPQAIRDTSGNPFAGITNNTDLSFTTGSDGNTPLLFGSTPIDNAGNVLASANIVLQFSSLVAAGGGSGSSGEIQIHRSQDGSLVQAFTVGGAGATANGSVVTINPTQDLDFGTDYYVTVGNQAVRDADGDFFAGIANATDLNFRTASDGIAPTLVGSTPADDAANVSASADIVLRFSNVVAAGGGSGSSGQIQIHRSQDNSLVQAFTIGGAGATANGSTVTLNPTQDLAFGTDYYVTVGIQAVRDTDGDFYAGFTNASTLNFTTGSAPPAGPGPSGPQTTPGPDTVAGPVAGITLSLLGGNDTFTGGAGPNLIYGNEGADSLVGGAGNDTFFGGQDNDLLQGGDGADSLYGNLGADVVYGNQGADVIYGNQGADTLFGGQGDDTIAGGQDDDLVYGNLGADAVYGNLGADVLFGGQGNDSLYGGQGNDTLVGGVGRNVLVGGLGADRYLFGANAATDLVVGFSQAEGDRLSLGGQSYIVSAAPDGNALLTLSGGGTIELVGIRAADVNASFFA